MLKTSENIGTGVKVEEVFTMVFGEELGFVVEDEDDLAAGSNEELEIFREVYYGECTGTGPLVVSSFSSVIDSSPGKDSDYIEMKLESEHTYPGTKGNLVCSHSSGLGGIVDNGGSTKYQCRIQPVRDVKIVEGKSVTSPISKESVASGLVLTGEAFAPTETPGALICIKESAEESVHFDVVGVVSKRPSTRGLPSRLVCTLSSCRCSLEN